MNIFFVVECVIFYCLVFIKERVYGFVGNDYENAFLSLKLSIIFGYSLALTCKQFIVNLFV